MPTKKQVRRTPSKSTARKSSSSRSTPTRRTPSKRASGGEVAQVKFSDKLTGSLQDITGMINEHKDMIDTIQDISLELTSAIGTLHTLTIKYAAKANKILDVLLPIIKGVPIIPKNITTLLVDLEKYTQKIIDNEKQTTKAISDVHLGLKTGDADMIKGHSKDLQKVTKTLTSILN